MRTLKRILVAVDWSDASSCAFRLAASLARDNGAQLDVLHVVPLEALMYGPPTEGYLNNLRLELEKYKPTDPKIVVRHLLAEGDPASLILKAASDSGCNLIVLGTHGRKGINRLLMGSVAETVLRKAGCMVLTVRSTASPIAETEAPNECGSQMVPSWNCIN